MYQKKGEDMFERLSNGSEMLGDGIVGEILYKYWDGELPVCTLKIANKMGIDVYPLKDGGDPYIDKSDGVKFFIDTNRSAFEQRKQIAKLIYYHIADV